MVQFYGRLWEGAKRPNSKPRSSFKVPEGTIAEGYLSEMNHVYMEIFPSYSQIVADYDKMQHRAQVYRKRQVLLREHNGLCQAENLLIKRKNFYKVLQHK